MSVSMKFAVASDPTLDLANWLRASNLGSSSTCIISIPEAAEGPLEEPKPPPEQELEYLMALNADEADELTMAAEELLEVDPLRRFEVNVVEEEEPVEPLVVVPVVELPSSRLFRVAIGQPEALTIQLYMYLRS